VHALPNVQTQSLAIQASAAANLLNNCIQVLHAKPSSSPNVKTRTQRFCKLLQISWHSHVQAFAAANLLKKRTFTFRFFMPSSSSPACANRQTQQQFELLLLQISSTFVFRFLHAKLIITNVYKPPNPAAMQASFCCCKSLGHPHFYRQICRDCQSREHLWKSLLPENPIEGKKKQ
jgi:hypothetical protein